MGKTPPRYFSTICLSVSLALAVCLGVPEVRAEASEIDDAEVARRLDYLEYSLEKGKVYANIWWWGWTVGQLGAAVIFGTLAYTDRDTPGSTANNSVSAVQSLLGGALLLVDPLDAAFVPRKIRGMPAGTPDERRAKLAAAEQGLRDAAAWEKLGRHWINHIMGFALGAVGFALLTDAFPDTDWKDGLFNFALSFGVTEIMIWTQPTRAMRDLEAYESAFSGDERGPEVSFGAWPGGGAVTVSF